MEAGGLRNRAKSRTGASIRLPHARLVQIRSLALCRLQCGHINRVLLDGMFSSSIQGIMPSKTQGGNRPIGHKSTGGHAFPDTKTRVKIMIPWDLEVQRNRCWRMFFSWTSSDALSSLQTSRRELSAGFRNWCVGAPSSNDRATAIN